MIEAARNAALKVEGATLLNASVDGDSYESHWHRKMVMIFLKGASDKTGIIDINHNLKNLCYYLIGGLCDVVF